MKCNNLCTKLSTARFASDPEDLQNFFDKCGEKLMFSSCLWHPLLII